MKKLSVILFTVILALSFAVMSWAEDETVAENNWKYEVTGDGTAKITKYLGNEGTVNIPAEIEGVSVSTLGSDVFRGNADVTKVVIPEGVKTIESTFYMTDNIEVIEIPSTVENISKRAFFCCYGLQSIEVAQESEYYSSADGILYDKAGKTLVNVPANKKMESFEIPAGVEVIGELSVRCLEIKELIIPDTVTKIERYAIYSNGLTELTIPGSVETLEDESIYYCSDLESIKFEEGSLKEISTMAINTCYKLEKIELPSNITNIGFFMECNALKEIIISENNESLCVADGVVFSKDKTRLVLYPRGREETSYTVPEGVEVIGENSFYGAKNLESVYLPDSIKAIEFCSFAYCSSLAKVYYDGSEAEFNEIDIDKDSVYFNEVIFKEAHVHSYDEVKVTKKATTKAGGKVQYTCSCGESYTETVYKISSIRLSTSKCTYNGKKRTPSVIVKDSKGNTLKKDRDYTVKYASGRKMPGRYIITVTFKGNYSGTKELDFVITPKTPTLKVSSAKGKVTLSWTEVTGVTGYQIYYSADGKNYKKLTSLSKEKYTKTLKSGKKYYFKVRGYVKPKEGSTVFGSYSSVKSIKVK